MTRTLLIIALLSLPALAQSQPPQPSPNIIQRQPTQQPTDRRPQPQTQQHRPPSGPIYRPPQHRPPYRTPPIYYPQPRYYPRPWPSYVPYWQYPRYVPPRPSGYWSWDSVQRRWVWRQSYYRGY